MVEEQVLILGTSVAPHGGIVGCKNGRLSELEQRRYKFVLRHQIEKLQTSQKNKQRQEKEKD